MNETSTARLSWIVPKENSPITVEKFLINNINLSPRSALKRAFRSKQVLVNSRPALRNQPIKAGDRIEIATEGIFAPNDWKIEPNPDLHLEIALETPRLIVIRKPSGQSAHPLRPDERHTTMNALAASHPGATAPFNPKKPLEGGLLHRIDRGTSGLLACAWQESAWRRYREAWTSGSMEKVYLAWVHGHFRHDGRIELFLTHDPKSKKRMTACFGKDKQERRLRALTTFLVLKHVTYEQEPLTLLLAQIHTGVMHQIRATLSNLGHPIYGDALYEKASRPSQLEAKFHRATPKSSALFKDLASRLQSISAPDRSLIPSNGFLLHALWLRSPEIPELTNGVFTPPPPAFGKTPCP